MKVVAGMAMMDGLVLLGRRKAMGRRGGLWEMPGGKVEEGEGAFDALKREWMEELGVAVEVGAYISSASLNLEVRFSVDLYHVRPETHQFHQLDHDELMWKSLRYAIEYLPCSPALYLHYPHIRSWQRDTRDLEATLADLVITHEALAKEGKTDRAWSVGAVIAEISTALK